MKKKIQLAVVLLIVVYIGYVVKMGIEFAYPRVEEIAQSTTDHLTGNSPIAKQGIGSGVYKVVIDPGHGGIDPGAEGASGSYEKDFNLSLSKKIKDALEEQSNIEVYMTREEDIFLSSETRERPQFANDLKADLFISIHGNTFEDPSVSGTETYYYHNYSKEFAHTIHRNVAAATDFRDRGVTTQDFFVLKDTEMPAALVEVGYITNPQEEQEMLKEEFQLSVANSIADGIKDYLEHLAS